MASKTDVDNEDDSSPFGTVDYVEILPTSEEQLEFFLERLRVIGREAEAVGFTVLIGISTDDPINKEDRWEYACFGSSIMGRGLCDLLSKRVFD